MKGCMRQIRAEGLNIERLIRQAGEADISLRHLRRVKGGITAVTDEACMDALQGLIADGGWRLQVGGRQGAGRGLDWLRRHRISMVLLLSALVMTVAASQMLWRIEIVGGGAYEPDIRAYLREMGVAPVCMKSKVDTGAIRDALEWRYPKVAWVECGWRGMSLRITVYEGVMPGEALSYDGSGDVVASRAGVVTSVVTVAGTAQVKRGEVVQAGDLLILGEERTTEGLVRPVSARGTVMARVWDGAKVRMNLFERQTVYTGRQEEVTYAAMPWFSLWKPLDSTFEQQDVAVSVQPLGGLFLPLTIRRETRMEARVTKARRDIEALKGEAGIAALRNLRRKVGFDDDFVDKWIVYCMIEDEELEASAIGERVIDIARRHSLP